MPSGFVVKAIEFSPTGHTGSTPSRLSSHECICYTPPPMPELLVALDAFLQEHRRCGDLDGGVEGGRVWMACDCGAGIAHQTQRAELARATDGPPRGTTT